MKIKYAFNKNYLLTASSMEGGRQYDDFEVNEVGIVPSHCYAILDFFECFLEGVEFKRIKLRNPWGRDTCLLG